MTRPLPGDFALTRISGVTGALISAGQFLIGDGAPVQHAMIYVGDGMIVQAMPGGAEMIPLDDASDPVIWSSQYIPLTWGQRTRMMHEALALVGTPYSFADYASIALAHYRIRPTWVREFVGDTGHMICSQLVDEVYRRAGIELFSDRIAGDITPGDLWKLLNTNRVAATDRQLWRLAHG